MTTLWEMAQTIRQEQAAAHAQAATAIAQMATRDVVAPANDEREPQASCKHASGLRPTVQIALPNARRS